MRQTLLFVIATLAFVASCAGGLAAQTQSDDPPSPRIEGRRRGEDESPQMSEYAARAALKREEAQRKETIDRAKEAARLAAELRDSFERTKSLSADGLTKLGQIEKLVRKIRSYAGGSGDDEPLEDPLQNAENAVERLAKIADELRERVEKTPRHVVSATVIERSNQLLELVKMLRGRK